MFVFILIGKGVVLPLSKEEAIQNLKDIMCEKIFGLAGNEVVIEEFITGEEVSVLAFTDGKTVSLMPGTQVKSNTHLDLIIWISLIELN